MAGIIRKGYMMTNIFNSQSKKSAQKPSGDQSDNKMPAKAFKDKQIVRRRAALCVSFNCMVQDPNSGDLKNQEKISQFSA